MSIVKHAVAGAVGFIVGAGAMMMPGNQKLRRQVLRHVDQIKRMSKTW